MLYIFMRLCDCLFFVCSESIRASQPDVNKLLLIVVIVLIVYSKSWSVFRGCSTTCGAHGVSERRRSVQMPSQCGGAKCPELVETRACTRFCRNGGTLTKETCLCAPGWSGECCTGMVKACFMLT